MFARQIIRNFGVDDAIRREFIPTPTLEREAAVKIVAPMAGINARLQTSMNPVDRNLNLFAQRFDTTNMGGAIDASAEVNVRTHNDAFKGKLSGILDEANNTFASNTSIINAGKNKIKGIVDSNFKLEEIPLVEGRDAYKSVGEYLNDAYVAKSMNAQFGIPIPRGLDDPKAMGFVSRMEAEVDAHHQALVNRRQADVDSLDPEGTDWLELAETSDELVDGHSFYTHKVMEDGTVNYYKLKGNDPFAIPSKNSLMMNVNPNVLRGRRLDVEVELAPHVRKVLQAELGEVGDSEVKKTVKGLVNDLIDDAEGKSVSQLDEFLDALYKSGMEPTTLAKYGTGDVFTTLTRRMDTASKKLYVSEAYGGTKKTYFDKRNAWYEKKHKELTKALRNADEDKKVRIKALQKKLNEEKARIENGISDWEDSYFQRGRFAEVDSKLSQALNDFSGAAGLNLSRQVISMTEDLGGMVQEFGLINTMAQMMRESGDTLKALTGKLNKTEKDDIYHSLGYAINETLANRKYDFVAYQQKTAAYDPYRITGLTSAVEGISSNIQRITGADMLQNFLNKSQLALIVRSHMDIMDKVARGKTLTKKQMKKINRSLLSEEEMANLSGIEGIQEIIRSKDVGKFIDAISRDVSGDRYMKSLKDEVLRTGSEITEGTVPNFFRTPVGRVFLQFKSFMFSSLSKRVIGGAIQRSKMDEEGLDMVSGVLVSVMLTHLGQYARATLDGREYDLGDEDNITRAFMNSSPMGLPNLVLGPLMEDNAYGAKRRAMSNFTPPAISILGDVMGMGNAVVTGNHEALGKELYKKSGVRLWMDLAAYATE